MAVINSIKEMLASFSMHFKGNLGLTTDTVRAITPTTLTEIGRP